MPYVCDMTYFSLKIKIIFIFVIVFVIFIFFLNFAGAYSIENSTDFFGKTFQSIFRQNPLEFAPIDLTKFIAKDPSGLSFSDLINTKSFSRNDIGASAKAALVLFLRLTVTALNVTLGLLKALLEILTKVGFSS